MTIDAHQHFWKYNPVRDNWITEDMNIIKKDFMPEDLKSILEENGIDGCVAVQADQSETETEFLLAQAKEYPWIKGVVGWVDLLSNDLAAKLTRYKEFPQFKGVRHILQAEPLGYMTDPRFINGVKEVGKQNLTYDILTVESQLDEVIKLIKELPEMPLVIDHISKPNIKLGSFEKWSLAMKTVSEFDHVHVKLSGMVTEADWNNWKPVDLEPYINFCIDTFTPGRLMFGSDWPVALLASTYTDWLKVIRESITKLSESEQYQILGVTATKFYDLK